MHAENKMELVMHEYKTQREVASSRDVAQTGIATFRRVWTRSHASICFRGAMEDV
jgi:hypothetical protein